MLATRRLPGWLAGVVGAGFLLTADNAFTAPAVPATAQRRTSAAVGGGFYRAIHLAGNWGTNRVNALNPPVAYLEYLASLNVSWVGLSVALHVSDAMDSTVERTYSGVQIPTFTDDELRGAIRAFRRYGFHFYLTLAFEDQEAQVAEHPIGRYYFGHPSHGCWAPTCPDHAGFVEEFFRTYTAQAVHFGALAQEEGVELFSLGTETNWLFRTRPSAYLPESFGTQLRAMADAVRAVYGGSLTYDMHYTAIADNYWELAPGLDHMWDDVGLDVVGVSAWWGLAPDPGGRVMSVAEMQSCWRGIFQGALRSLKDRNPTRPIVFLEFGYVDLPFSVSVPNYGNFTPRIPIDADGDGLDDGEETQANAWQAFFDVMESEPDLVSGAFGWENWIATDPEWRLYFAPYRTLSIRGKLAERVVRERYARWRAAATGESLGFLHTVPPCRLADTRAGEAPALAAHETRSFAAQRRCAIPADATAVALNLTVVQPTAVGHLALFATGDQPPATSSVNFVPGRTRANNAIANLGNLGRVSVRNGMAAGSAHVVLDVSGYFR